MQEILSTQRFIGYRSIFTDTKDVLFQDNIGQINIVFRADKEPFFERNRSDGEFCNLYGRQSTKSLFF